MSWVGWRLQRMETLVVIAILAALAVLLVPQALHMSSAFDARDFSGCTSKQTQACGEAVSAFLERFSFVRDLLDWFRLVPGAIGVLLAAPLVLELENGTYRLAWTQGVTRGRLLTAKLTVAVVTALLAAGAFSLLVTWSRRPLDELVGRMASPVFDIEGTVPLAWTILALGLALVVGVLVRRTGASLVVAFAAYVGSRILVDSQLRPHYLMPVTRHFTVGTGPPALERDLVLTDHLVDAAGRPFTVTSHIVNACSGSRLGGGRGVGACLARHGAASFHVVYQPAGRFWLFQGLETALVGAVGLTLVALAALWLRRRPS